MNLKTVLVTLCCVAVALGLVTFYVVFYSGGGTYVVSSALGPDAGIFATSTPPPATADSTPSSTLALASSSASSTTSSTLPSTQIGAAPVAWTQGNETLSVTDATVSGSQLTLGVQVAMGSVSECVPLNMRMIADEQGDLSPPITPQFTFPDTGTCNGTPGETYSAQPIVFTLDTPFTFPIILTTGGTANVLFEVVQNSDGSLTVQLPPNSD
jgi:hypothetical protein